jgi:flagellar protein FlbD
MIHLTRINHVPLVLNADLIEHMESTPNTVISLSNGQKFVVLEPVEQVIDRIIQFRRAIYRCNFLDSRGPESRESVLQA